MMTKVIVKEKAHFRIEIKDLNKGVTRTISLTNHGDTTVDELKAKVIKCFTK